MSCLEPEDERPYYFDNPKLSDVTIHFGDHEVKAHRVTLASKSGYFRKMFESEFLEASARDVRLYEDDPDALYGMLAYLYDCTYHGQRQDGKPIIRPNTLIPRPRGDFNGQEGREYLKYIVRVYEVADKYGVARLTTLIESEFQEEMEWLQERYTPFANVGSANELVSIFEQLAELLYHSLGDVAEFLRFTLAKAVHKRTPELMDNERYQHMVKNIPDFALDLLELATQAMKDLTLQLQEKSIAQMSSFGGW
ncbi:hypothetical protein PRZ48_005762 [Zasmidium cellare]|uniref:BTB domain-containing protein n=1 Tax=Zasmidium cellare TaxID=395010 RepID=A0ABR0EL92_ZASCE|nr:hypothetical protein PRZ48_005762 [Zasmidium cellare]